MRDYLEQSPYIFKVGKLNIHAVMDITLPSKEIILPSIRKIDYCWPIEIWYQEGQTGAGLGALVIAKHHYPSSFYVSYRRTVLQWEDVDKDIRDRFEGIWSDYKSVDLFEFIKAMDKYGKRIYMRNLMRTSLARNFKGCKHHVDKNARHKTKRIKG